MDPIKNTQAFYRMNRSDLDATEERATEMISSETVSPENYADARETYDSVLFEKKFRDSSDQEKAQADLGRFLFDLGVEDYYSDLAGSEYESRIQEASKNWKFADSLVFAAL